MLKDIKGHRLVEIDMVMPNQTYALPHAPYQVQDVPGCSAHNERGECSTEGWYVPVFDVREGGAMEHDIGDFITENVDEAWSQFEETLAYDADIGNAQPEHVEKTTELGDWDTN